MLLFSGCRGRSRGVCSGADTFLSCNDTLEIFLKCLNPIRCSLPHPFPPVCLVERIEENGRRRAEPRGEGREDSYLFEGLKKRKKKASDDAPISLPALVEGWESGSRGYSHS